MRKYLKLTLVSALIFFFIGFGWGLWTKKIHFSNLKGGDSLQVLCGDGWLSSDVLTRFSKAHSIHIQLWTYTQPDQFLRQMANANGHFDVVCASSFLVRGLIQSQWIAKANFSDLPNAQTVSVDFTHLPYDPDAAYTVPIFWNLYGLFAKGDAAKTMPWKDLWASKKLTIWAGELNVMDLLSSFGLNFDQGLEMPAPKPIEDQAKRLLDGIGGWLDPQSKLPSAEQITARGDVVEVPLSRVARLLGEGSPYRFWLPKHGAPLEVGVLAIGSRAPHRELALDLVNELLSDQSALDTYHQLNAGVVNESLSHLSSLAPMQRAQAIREFPLTRFRFPDLDLESLPRFQKVFDDLKPAAKSLVR